VNGDWRTSPPGNAAAEHLRRWIDERIAEVEIAALEDVRVALKTNSWSRGFNSTGMTRDAFDDVRRCLDTAWYALRGPDVNVEAATTALQMARAVLTPPLNAE
jgi:hypothetical protein